MMDRLRSRQAAPIIREAEPPRPLPSRPRIVPAERMTEAISTATAEVIFEVDNAMAGLLKVRDEAHERNRVMIDAVDQHVRNNGQIVQALRKMSVEYINTMLHLMATAWQPEAAAIASDAEAPGLAMVERELAAPAATAEHQDP